MTWPRPLAGEWTPPQVAAAALLPANRRVAVASGNGLGKTHLIADIAISFLLDGPGLVLAVAPTREQLRAVLWPQFYDRLRRVGWWSKPDDGPPSWTDGPHVLRSRATNKAARLQGFHAPRMLVIVEEASGVDSELLAAVHGIAVGENNWIFLVGNPNEAKGALWDAMGSPAYVTQTISALDHPNVTARRNVIPGAVTWESICSMVREWCRECPAPEPESFTLDVPADVIPLQFDPGLPRHWIPNDEFRVRVLGRWPRQPGASLFASDDVTACADLPVRPSGDHVASLDVARFGGDHSVWCERRGYAVTALELWPQLTVPDTAARAREYLRDRKPQQLTVDAAGVGAGVYDLLQSEPVPVRRFVGADEPISPADALRYMNRRAVAYGRLAEAVAKRLTSLPADPDLLAELTAITVSHDDKSRLRVEPKELLRRKLGRSTDRADAVSMLWDTAPATPGVRTARRKPEADW